MMIIIRLIYLLLRLPLSIPIHQRALVTHLYSWHLQ